MKASTDEAGKFTALVSVFGNVDREGDVVERGAFSRSLTERGLPPVFYSHHWEQLPVGMTEKAEETDDGLVIEAQLFMDVPAGRHMHAALSAGALKEFSFAYEVVEAAEETRDGQTVRLLKDLELFEVGPTLVGMNPATALLDVRSGLAAGEAKHEQAETDDGSAGLRLRARGLMLARPR